MFQLPFHDLQLLMRIIGLPESSDAQTLPRRFLLTRLDDLVVSVMGEDEMAGRAILFDASLDEP